MDSVQLDVVTGCVLIVDIKILRLAFKKHPLMVWLIWICYFDLTTTYKLVWMGITNPVAPGLHPDFITDYAHYSLIAK